MLQAILFSFLLSLDAFTSSIAYGASHIKIPFLEALEISGIGVLFLGLSFFLSFFLKGFIDESVARIIGCIILCGLGLHNLLMTWIRKLIKKRKEMKPIQFEVSNIHIMLEIYLDETSADFDHSKRLNSKEALFLAIALSIDSLATGFSMGLGNIHYGWFLIFTFCFTLFAVLFGSYFGKKVTSRVDFAWMSGVLLVFLGILKLW